MIKTALYTETTKTAGKRRKLRRYLNLFVFGALLLYFACSPLSFYLLFELRPVKASAYDGERSGLNRQDVYFASKNGSKIHAWYYETPGAVKTVLLHHGQGGNLSTYRESAEALTAAGANVLLYDFQGFGKSEGSAIHPNACDDAEAAYQYLVQTKHIEPNQIVQAGLSFGTGLACRMAQLHPCPGVILVSPYASLQRVAHKHFPFLRFYPSFLYPQPDIGAQQLFTEKPMTPVLMIHAIGDRLLPVEQANEIFALARGQKTFERLTSANGVHMGGLGESSAPLCRTFLQTLPAISP